MASRRVTRKGGRGGVLAFEVAKWSCNHHWTSGHGSPVGEGLHLQSVTSESRTSAGCSLSGSQVCARLCAVGPAAQPGRVHGSCTCSAASAHCFEASLHHNPRVQGGLEVQLTKKAEQTQLQGNPWPEPTGFPRPRESGSHPVLCKAMGEE